ncbi:TM2 domain-containing protein 3 almondex isoform X2 [Tachypleus tridentatus]|uniref:TM2 domain-containing protein 3 almondex isoform X2 n=1 Tax=Tachypleus tridentatus TaxID=6853 RepID=UPI003FCFC700
MIIRIFLYYTIPLLVVATNTESLSHTSTVHGFRHSGLQHHSESTLKPAVNVSNASTTDSVFDTCTKHVQCEELPVHCINCRLNETCIYGEKLQVECQAKSHATCQGNNVFYKEMICRYCYQTNSDEHTCVKNTSCRVVSTPRQHYITQCKVHDHILCLEQFLFHEVKMVVNHYFKLKFNCTAQETEDFPRTCYVIGQEVIAGVQLCF